jgi:CheY-like chemotaxis protein
MKAPRDRRTPVVCKGQLMPKILVVDDEPIIAVTIADWLDDLGHEVVGPAADVVNALALAEQPLDAAILDISLGQETTLAVASRLTERGVPFAVATGHDHSSINPVFAERILLPKPFGFETFRHVVAQLLQGQGGAG